MSLLPFYLTTGRCCSNFDFKLEQGAFIRRFMLMFVVEIETTIILFGVQAGPLVSRKNFDSFLLT